MGKPLIFVVQVQGGRENHACELIRTIAHDVVQECFTPASETARKHSGQWRRVTCLLFPGYVFVKTDSPEQLQQRLRAIPVFMRLLGASNDSILPLADDEVAWLNAFTDARTHVVRMSEGIIDGDAVIVTDGPLKGHEGLIKRIDRHRRQAMLEVQMLGRTKQIRIGLEIVYKRQQDS